MTTQPAAYSLWQPSQELATRGISTTSYKMTEFLASGNLKSQVRNSKNDGHTLNYSMEQSPSWEANRFSASQEILRILWNP